VSSGRPTQAGEGRGECIRIGLFRRKVEADPIGRDALCGNRLELVQRVLHSLCEVGRFRSRLDQLLGQCF
jgi:hypothetical protein